MKTIALSLFMAVVGFSYALATRSEMRVRAVDASPRAAAPSGVGTPLRFTNAFLGTNVDQAYFGGGNTATDPQGFDLGDALKGQSVTRYLSAAGGGMPYTFETRPNFDFLGKSDSAVIPHLELNGKIVDTFQSAVRNALRFNAVVTDFLGTQRVGTFRINFFSSVSAFRFAQDKLPRAQLGNTFFTNIETLFPHGVVTYTVNGPVLVNGAKFNRLEEVGLTLTPYGVLFGRPAFPRVTAKNAVMTIAFVVHAADSAGNVALGRSGVGQDQAFVIQVEDNVQASSEILASNCRINADSVARSSDSFVFNGSFDPKGFTVDSFAGSPFTLNVNGQIFSGTFDARGRVKSGSKNSNALNVTISPANASLQIRLSGATLYSAVNPAQISGSINLPVILAIEFKHYRACEAITMEGRAARSKLMLFYSVGGRGKSLAGGMQIINVKGQDKKFFDGTKGDTGVDGDGWLVRWIGMPRFSIDAGAATAFPLRDPALGLMQTNSVSASIRIGNTALGPVTATIGSYAARFKGNGTTPGIYQLILDGQHFVHSVLTNPLPPSDTGLPQAIFSKSPTIFRFGMNIPGFSGETGRVIVPNKNAWQAR